MSFIQLVKADSLCGKYPCVWSEINEELPCQNQHLADGKCPLFIWLGNVRCSSQHRIVCCGREISCGKTIAALRTVPSAALKWGDGADSKIHVRVKVSFGQST